MANLIGQRLGQYQIVAFLGKGGMATVYRARQTNIEREVAVKVIKPDLAEIGDFIRRFRREAETIASLRHPHILKLFDFGEQGDLVYLVMDLLSGGSLADLIHHGPLSQPVAARILDHVASALDYAHRRGVIHRDMKPQNVLLDEDGNAYLTDFGIAKLLTETTALTQSGAAMGTPAYMSPEQWQGLALDARADIYALGVMLFEMLAGKLPFNADTPYSMMNKHIHEPPPSIRTIRADLPPGVDGVIQRALSKNREERFNSGGELAAAFRAALAGEASVLVTNAAPLPPDGDTNVQGRTTGSPGRPAPALSAPQPSGGGKRPLLVGIVAIAAILILIGGVILAFLGGGTTTSNVSQATTATPVPAAVIPTLTVFTTPSTPTINSTTDPVTLTAASRAVQQTSTANAVGVAMTNAAETAIGIASFTKTPAPIATFTPPGTATPFGGGSGKIAFSSFRDGKQDIYVMDADGQNQRNLTYSGYEIDAAWSPDGAKIAFVSSRDENNEIYVMDADGTNQRRLTNNTTYDGNPKWSPDGGKIAFTSKRDGNNEIYVMDADGTNQRRLTNDKGDDERPAWSPDGSKIAFATDREGVLEIYVMDADGTNLHNLTNSPAEDWDPAWSPDGSKIAFISNRDGNAEVYVMDADGTNQRNLTRTRTDEFIPAWSPDGTQIAYTTELGGNQDIYVMDADGKNQHDLTLINTSANDLISAWQPVVMPSVTALVATATTTSNPTRTPVPASAATSIPTSAILYWTDFEDGKTSGWLSEDCVGTWQVITEDNGNHAYRGIGAFSCASYTHIGLSTWKNYAVDLRFKPIKGDNLEIAVRAQDFDNFYALGIYPPFGGDVGLRRKKAGDFNVFNQQPILLKDNDWNTVHIEVKGAVFRASINGQSMPAAIDSTFANGYLGLFVAPGSTMLFDDIHVWSI